MDDKDLHSLTTKVHLLIEQVHALRQANQQLRVREQTWQQERLQLIDKHEQARSKVEAIISRLKALEQDS